MSNEAEYAAETIQYPALFRVAERTSESAQRIFLRLFRANLGLLLAGALFASISSDDIAYLRVLRTGAAFAFATSVLVSIVMRQRNDEEAWYGGRAAAESIKTRTWLYMMAADPYPPDLSPRDADRRFTDDLASILRQQDQLGIVLQPDLSDERVQIPEYMRQVRTMNWSERLTIYRESRVLEQCGWYSKNARVNHQSERMYYWLTIGSQVAALGAAVWMAIWPVATFDYTAVIATLAASYMSWTQLKKYGELAHIYEITSNELGLVAEQLPHIGSQEELAGFVKDAESAISREHTLWVARRSYRLSRS
jgi:hypothetical protein